MSDRLRGATAVVGMATAGMGESPGSTAMELMAEASAAALADAGLTLADVDGLFVNSSVHSLPIVSAAEYLGIQPRYANGSAIGGSAFEAHCLNAAMALDAGVCDVALIAYGSVQRSAGGKLLSLSEPQPFDDVHRPLFPTSSYALAAARHMHEFGTTREHFAEVAVAARRWAQLNPKAFVRTPLSIGDVMKSRMVSDPLSKLDCCLVTDGGAAVVMTRADRAKSGPHPPVYLLGCAGELSHRQIAQMPDLTTTISRESARRAYEMAKLSPRDIDVVQLYDAFTINTVLFLEDLGFCPKGEGGRFVSGGRIAPGGELPVNTFGGGLSCVHPGMLGLFLIVEAVEQLRGSAGERQIAGAETAIAHGNGGVFSSEVTAIFGTANVL